MDDVVKTEVDSDEDFVAWMADSTIEREVIKAEVKTEVKTEVHCKLEAQFENGAFGDGEITCEL